MQQRTTLTADEAPGPAVGGNGVGGDAVGSNGVSGDGITRLAAWVEDFRTGLDQHDTFEVDAERLPALNAELRCIINLAEHALADARDLRDVEAPACDDVSVHSTGRLNDVGAESIVRTCEDIHHWLLGLRTQVEKALAAPNPEAGSAEP